MLHPLHRLPVETLLNGTRLVTKVLPSSVESTGASSDSRRCAT